MPLRQYATSVFSVYLRLLQAVWTKHPHLLAAVIILATTAVRLFFISTSQLSLVQDEAQYWDWTRHLQLSYYSKGPLIAWVIELWTTVFGDTEFGVRFGAMFNSMLVQGILYGGIAGIMRLPSLGLWTLIVANTMPLFLVTGVLMTTDNPMLLCWVTALVCLYRIGLPNAKMWHYVLFTVCIAAGILAKYMMLAIPAIALFYLWGLHRTRLLPQGVWKKVGISLAVGIILGFTPILLWNSFNDFVGFRHVAGLAGVASAKGVESLPFIRFDRVLPYFSSQVGLVAPWWFFFLMLGAWHSVKAWRFTIFPSRYQENIVDSADDIRRDLLFSAAFVPLWCFFLLWSFHTQIYPNWSAMSYAAGMVLCASAVERFPEQAKNAVQAAKRIRWRRIWVACGVLIFALMYAQNILPLPAKINPTARLKGWEDLGHKLASIEGELNNPNGVFYFSRSYDVTAELAFYAPNQPQAYCLPYGRRMCQYDLWSGPQEKIGWDAVYVQHAGGISDKTRDFFAKAFAEHRVVEYTSTHRGGDARRFTLVILKNYNGFWENYMGNKF